MATKQPSYTETLLAVLKVLERMETKADSRPMKLDPVAQERLGALGQRQDEMIGLLREMNGSVREHAESLAVQGQWIRDHEGQVHTELSNKVQSAATKAGIAAGIGGALAVLIAIALALLGG